MNDQERDQQRIKELPGSLYEALVETAKSQLVKDILGADLQRKILENKQAEWDDYRTKVTDYERDRYLPIL